MTTPTHDSLTNPKLSPVPCWELTVLSPALGDLSIPLTTSLSIGRHTENDVVLAVPQISRRHAKFNQVGQHLYLQDLNSANGTFVNGERIGNEAVAVNANDEIGFADLLFVLSSQNQALVNETSENIVEVEKANANVQENSPSIPLPTLTKKVVTEPVVLPPQVVEPVSVESAVAPAPTVPTITAPIEPQTISPITAPTDTPTQPTQKFPASKNMWLVAIVIILLIAGLVIAKMVL